jgi:CheY-like chemotaxis protein
MTPLTPGSILVIDDEPRLVRALAILLRRDGYHVETASNGRHALAQLQVQRYDVIVSDLSMPEMDGRTFYTHLRQQAPGLARRVIFFTGAYGEASSAAFLAQCGQPWLPKPCPIAVLRRTIQQVLQTAASARTRD